MNKPVSKGMLFKPDMILALLNTKPDVWPAKAIDSKRAWKWQTRRLVTCDWNYGPDLQGYLKHDDVTRYAPETGHATEAAPHPVGSFIYAKERYGISGNGAYYPDQTDGTVKHAWRNAMFMPKAMARLWFVVMDVRVERVNAISDPDAIAEGIEPVGGKFWRNYLPKKIEHPTNSGFVSPIESYKSLWDSINGKGSFDTGPWVWCYSLKRITKPKP